jgi:hypothetical protein
MVYHRELKDVIFCGIFVLAVGLPLALWGLYSL